MISLNLSVGPWSLSFDLSRDAAEAEPTTLRISLSDLTEAAESDDEAAAASFGFGPTEA